MTDDFDQNMAHGALVGYSGPLADDFEADQDLWGEPQMGSDARWRVRDQETGKLVEVPDPKGEEEWERK